MTNLADRTPPDIDAEINELQYNEAVAEKRANEYTNLKFKYAQQGNEYYVKQYGDQAENYYRQAENYRAKLTPLYAEYTRRGGWTRFYLVNNTNGHVHWTQACNTCFATTQFGWLTQFSGTSHEDLVELAGEKACTVCFPDAPVDTLKRPAKWDSDTKARKAAEKAAAEAEKRANEVVVENYRDGRRAFTKVFKTERAATNEIASTLSSMVGYGESHPSFNEWQSNVANIIAGLALKGVEYDYAEALEKARKKCRTEHAKFRKSPQWLVYKEQGVLAPEALVEGYDPVKF